MSDNGNANTENEAVPPQNRWDSAVQIIKTRKVDAALWATRFLTIFFAALYLLPIFGSPVNYYYKAFIASAATSALRLHQRAPQISLTRTFFGTIIIEDSCHYLFYALIFIYCSPITIALLPIMLFALLHFSSFSLTLLDSVGHNTGWLARIFISLIELHTVTILRMVAGAEIFTMVFAIIYTMMGRASILTPFVYYRFLTLRYSSRRNHYTRTMFTEFRFHLDRVCNHPSCPSLLSKMIKNGINVVSRFAPEMQAQQ